MTQQSDRPADTPPIVVLDVFNLRGSYGEIRNQPFGMAEYDDYVRAIQLAAPNAVIVGILDGSAADDDRAYDFASVRDQEELIRRSQLPTSDLKYIHLLPQHRKDRRWDDQYLHADPVCVHLLRQFQPACALITHDGLNKSGDFKFLAAKDPLRNHIFRPWWAKSESSWVFVSRRQLEATWKLLRKSRVENREVQRIEDFLKAFDKSTMSYIETRELAFGYVHDYVNEYRAEAAARRKAKTTFGDTSRPRSPFDQLNPADFDDAPAASEDLVDSRYVEFGWNEPSDVLVQVAAEQIDLIGSIDELGLHLDKRIRVDAMLQIEGDAAYLVWFGHASRVRVAISGLSASLKDGLVRVEGVLSRDNGELAISVASASDLQYRSISDVAKDRLSRLVTRDLYVGGGGTWGFPRLPRRGPRRIPPPPSRFVTGPEVPASGTSVSIPAQSESRHTTPDRSLELTEPITEDALLRRNLVNVSTTRTTSDNESSIREPVGTDKTEVSADPSQSSTRRRWLAVGAIGISVAALLLAYFLRTDVSGVEVPAPAVCLDLNADQCDVVVAEWRGDALRVNLYGTRTESGIVG